MPKPCLWWSATTSGRSRTRPEGATLKQIAKDFVIHPMTLSDWMRKAAMDAENKTAAPSPSRPSELVRTSSVRIGDDCKTLIGVGL